MYISSGIEGREDPIDGPFRLRRMRRVMGWNKRHASVVERTFVSIDLPVRHVVRHVPSRLYLVFTGFFSSSSTSSRIMLLFSSPMLPMVSRTFLLVTECWYHFIVLFVYLTCTLYPTTYFTFGIKEISLGLYFHRLMFTKFILNYFDGSFYTIKRV